MRMCYSSDIFVKAFFRQNEESFLEGIISGFEHFDGVTNKIIFDNAKVAVKEGFGLHAKIQDKYKLLSAHYCFKPEFCNIASGHEKWLVEGLVGWIRRNTLVPIPKVNNIDELNYLLIEQCKKYRNHQIQRKPLTVGELAKIDRNKLLPLPLYKFDSSKSITIKVDEFSTVKYDYNYYSVPIEYANKSVTIKGFGNEILILYRNTMIAKYQRVYLRNETIYSLNHYINLLEKRPRSVFNAKPVKRTVTKRLLDIGQKLESNREMVKLLRLCIDYGESNVLESIDTLGLSSSITVDKILEYLQPNRSMSNVIKITDPITVNPVQLNKYDELMKGVQAIWVL